MLYVNKTSDGYPPGNGSDVFGSDICTCKPYLTYAIEGSLSQSFEFFLRLIDKLECIHTAQRGGVGVVVYFRKEGRALGEVTKYVHNYFYLSRIRWGLTRC